MTHLSHASNSAADCEEMHAALLAPSKTLMKAQQQSWSMWLYNVHMDMAVYEN